MKKIITKLFVATPLVLIALSVGNLACNPNQNSTDRTLSKTNSVTNKDDGQSSRMGEVVGKRAEQQPGTMAGPNRGGETDTYVPPLNKSVMNSGGGSRSQ